MLIFRCPPSHQMQVSRGRSLLLFSVPVSGDLILRQVIEKLPWIGRLSSSSESRTYISKTPISTRFTSLHSIWHEKNLLFTLTDSLICRIYLVLASQPYITISHELLLWTHEISLWITCRLKSLFSSQDLGCQPRVSIYFCSQERDLSWCSRNSSNT